MDVTDLFPQLRILLVDDEPFIRKVTSKVLDSLNIHKVLEAENGHAALQVLEQHEIDLLITDIQMPDMNGIELIKRIRMGDAPCDCGLRTVVATSFSNTEVLGSCLALDINGFLVKPVTPVGAVQKIEQALKEQTHLRAADVYARVKTDLATLAEANKTEERKVQASVPREETGGGKSGDTSVSLRFLKPGMILQEDLYARHGVKLLSAGQMLNEGLVNRIHELSVIIDALQVRVRL